MAYTRKTRDIWYVYIDRGLGCYELATVAYTRVALRQARIDCAPCAYKITKVIEPTVDQGLYSNLI